MSALAFRPETFGYAAVGLKGIQPARCTSPNPPGAVLAQPGYGGLVEFRIGIVVPGYQDAGCGIIDGSADGVAQQYAPGIVFQDGPDMTADAFLVHGGRDRLAFRGDFLQAGISESVIWRLGICPHIAIGTFGDADDHFSGDALRFAAARVYQKAALGAQFCVDDQPAIFFEQPPAGFSTSAGRLFVVQQFSEMRLAHFDDEEAEGGRKPDVAVPVEQVVKVLELVNLRKLLAEIEQQLTVSVINFGKMNVDVTIFNPGILKR